MTFICETSVIFKTNLWNQASLNISTTGHLFCKVNIKMASVQPAKTACPSLDNMDAG